MLYEVITLIDSSMLLIFRPLAQQQSSGIMGFGLRGEKVVPNLFGTLTSPGTFGNYGSGSTRITSYNVCYTKLLRIW